MNISESNAWLNLLADEPDRLRKKLIALGIIADRLIPQKIVPVLIGGTAVEYYSGGEYTSDDVDLALISSDAVDTVFSDFYFRKEGRFWIRNDLDLLFEAPVQLSGKDDAPSKEIAIDGLTVTILAIEDLLIHRLRKDERWTRRLTKLYANSLDWDYIRQKISVNMDERSAFEKLEREFK